MNLSAIAIASISISVVCFIIIIVHLARHPQQMAIMNVVWPVTALYAGPLGLLIYFNIGGITAKEAMKSHKNRHHGVSHQKPFWQSVLTGTLHCGSGCALGDLFTANLLLVIPVTVFGSKMLGEWAIEYIAAFLIGIIFQYFAIKPMSNISAKDALIAALKADTLSLTAWQVGMYGWMAVCNLLIFHTLLKAPAPVFWLMMQIGMLLGLLTAYPVNWWLIKKGIKEAM
jgi:hypothetical protein